MRFLLFPKALPLPPKYTTDKHQQLQILSQKAERQNNFYEQ